MNTRSKTVTLDVRAEIRAGREPFSKIMAAVAALKRDEDLLLIAPFEPKPLLGVLAAQGLSHVAKELPGGDWEVRFTRTGQGGTGGVTKSTRPRKTGVVEIDARDLEPPQPMVVILEALEDLAKDAELRARTARRPVHLHPQLAARGFRGESVEQPDGSFITIIRHA